MIIRLSVSTFLYLTLFLASLNDVLRIGNTDFSFFRCVLPLAWILVFRKNKRYFSKWFLIYITVITINLFQTIAFTKFNSLGISFLPVRYNTYLFYGFCIFSVLYFVRFLCSQDEENHTNTISKFILFVSWVLLIVLYIGALTTSGLIRHTAIVKKLANINNYGMYMNVAIPFHLIDYLKRRKRISILFIVLAVIGMRIGDCNIGLLGIILELLLFYLLLPKTAGKSVKKYLIVYILLFIVAAVAIIILSLTGNGTALFRNDFLQAIKLVLSGNLLSKSNTSMLFRVNTTILCVAYLFRSYCLGIGYGNLSIVIRNILGDYSLQTAQYDKISVAVHNTPLEILVEFGPLAIVLYWSIIKKIIRNLRYQQISHTQLIFMVYSMSMPIWLIAPANIISAYYFYIAFMALWLMTN